MLESRYRVHPINLEDEIIIFAMDHIQKMRKRELKTDCVNTEFFSD